MSYERSKAPLALMEQIIMILVFALTAAVCMQAFVYSNRLSEKGERGNRAASYVQEVVETCKTFSGDLLQARQKLSGEQTDKGFRVCHEEDRITVTLEVTEQSAWLTKARVTARDEKQEELFAVDAAWQRGGQS